MLRNTRNIDLFKEPFNFPRPIKTFRDDEDKVLSVWEVASLPSYYFPSEDPKVLVAILARNKAHVLPDYLKCLYEQTFPKQQMVLYIYVLITMMMIQNKY